MNKGQILDLITNPRPISKSEAEGFKQVLIAYPYFTAANYLLAKYYHEQDDFQYQQQLKITATQTNNRKSLYKLIHENVPARELASEIITESPKTEPASIEIALNKAEQDHVVVDIESSKNNEEKNGIESLVDEVVISKKDQQLTEVKSESIVSEHSELATENKHLALDSEEQSFEANANNDSVSHETSFFTETISEVFVDESTTVSELETEQASDPENFTTKAERDFRESEDSDLAHEDDIETSLNPSDQINVNEVLNNPQHNIQEYPNTTLNTEQTNSRKESQKDKSIDEFISVVEANPIKHRVDLNIITNAIETNLDVNSVAAKNSSEDDGKEHSFIYWLKRPASGKSHQENIELSNEKESNDEVGEIKEVELQAGTTSTSIEISTNSEKSQQASLEAEITNLNESTLESEIKEIHVDETVQKTSKLDKVKASEILEKFIETQPKISKPKVDFYSPVNMAKQSVADHDELVTETLGTIYMAQGNYLKAIKVYESLIYKFPDKEAYFKKLIKKAKDRMQPKK
jgi:tetratricopeptide (TPR) repeat protein